MILRRVTQHVREQNWTAIAIDFVIVVVGVFLGIQIGNWNSQRIEAQRRGQIIAALVTNLSDAISVQEGFVAEIESGRSNRIAAARATYSRVWASRCKTRRTRADLRSGH